MTKTLLDKLVKQIPHAWMSTKLKKIVTMEKGKKPDKIIKEYSCGLKPYLTAENMRNNDYTLWCEEGKTIVKSNEIDTLLIWDGSNAGEVFHGRDGIVASTMVKVTPRTENVNWKYLFYSISDYNNILRSTTNGTSIPHVSQYVFNNLVIPLPPLSEQQEIVEILSTVDDVIGKTNTIIEETMQMKKGLMQKLFTEGIGHTRFKETMIGMMPEEWDIVSFNEVTSLMTNGFVGTATPHYSKSEDAVTYLQGFNVRANRIDLTGVTRVTKEFSDKQSKSKLKEGDILTVQSGHIGTTCVVPHELEGSNCHALIITRFVKEIINPHFIAYYLNSSSGSSRIKAITVGSTVLHINVKDFKKFKIPLPSQDEQSDIVNILSEVDAKIKIEQITKEQLQLLKKGLMQVLLTGKVRVKV